jgi:hypothetical protein
MKKLPALIYMVLAIAMPAMGQSPGLFHFTGTSFQEGAGSGAAPISVQDGFLPATANKVPAKAVKLPSGSGGIALLCYVQKSGGKMGSKGGYDPIVGAPIEVNGEGMKFMARTDESGYLFLALPAGQYEIKFSPFAQKIRIDKGKNTLTAIRGGKRMVD